MNRAFFAQDLKKRFRDEKSLEGRGAVQDGLVTVSGC
jgi:hypothetical protein